ncbi:MAG: protein kinase [Kiritimatiellae bacterium]|nr:protein kinase [Kiritimatiellia bacterium]
MLITFHCPNCDSKLEIESDAAGTSLECPQCRGTVIVPRKSVGSGATIGGFRLVSPLGAGAMGEVYLAHQLSMDREVAVKILPPRMTADKDLVERFILEVRTVARLDHPHIVTAYEAGEDAGVYYMAMAYVKGDPLDIRLEREGPIEEEEALEIAGKIASALAYAWNEHQILHRDVKPQNILLDHHGEPKLTDLGLSTTLSRVEPGPAEETVVGTPNYMSPEQAQGRPDVDFRADMYSLGATLYHMLTGRIPFEGDSIPDILRKQVSEPLPNPRALNPGISEPCVALMAIMLSKDRDQRHESWEALIADIERAMAGEMPKKTLLAPGESAILRIRGAGVQGRGRGVALAAVALLVLALAGAVIYFLALRPVPPESEPAPREAPAPVPAPSETATEERTVQASRLFSEAVRYHREHPFDVPGVRARFEEVLKTGAGTALEMRALEALEQLEHAEAQALEKVMEQVRAEAEAMFGEGKMEEAVALVEQYDGPLAAGTEKARAELAEDLRKRILEVQAEQKRKADADRLAGARIALSQLTAAVARDILKDDFDGARQKIAAAESGPGMEPVSAEVEALRKSVASIGALTDAVLESFRQDEGKNVTVGFKRGRQSLLIGRVSPPAVVARRQMEGAGYVERRFTVEELSTTEKLTRLGDEPDPERDIMRGLLQYQLRRPDAALQYFRRSGLALGHELAGLVEGRLNESKEAEAERAYTAVLRAAGLPAEAPADENTLRRIRRTAYPAADVVRIRGAVEQFQQAHASSAKAAEAASVLKALARVDSVPQEVDTTILQAAVKRIERDNPQVTTLLAAFDTTDEGLEFDLSKNAELRDLSGLAGLPVARLNLSETKVRDLAPLRGMPLTRLDAHQTPVDDIGILEGMPLNDLNLAGTRVRNIAPLKGAPLTRLLLGSTPVDRLTALVDMPLDELDLGACPVEDIRPLRSLPLTRLSLWRTKVTDLKALKGMTLTWLHLGGTKVSDLSALEGMPLNSLVLGGTPVSDLSVLPKLPLGELYLDFCLRVTDLSPLQGMPLKALGMTSLANVKDFSSLRGMPLERVSITGTPISDWTIFSGMTTLKAIGWQFWDQHSLLKPVSGAIAQKDFAGAARAGARIAAMFEGVPAFEPFVASLRSFLDLRLPEWEKAAREPGGIRSQAQAHGGHAYALCPLFVDLAAAEAFCAKHGGHLATVQTKDEMNWIAAEFSAPGILVRLGGTDARKEGQWQWSTGEPMNFVNWERGKPDNYRGIEHSMGFIPGGLWDDIPAESLCPFLVEWDQ